MAKIITSGKSDTYEMIRYEYTVPPNVKEIKETIQNAAVPLRILGSNAGAYPKDVAFSLCSKFLANMCAATNVLESAPDKANIVMIADAVSAVFIVPNVRRSTDLNPNQFIPYFPEYMIAQAFDIGHRLMVLLDKVMERSILVVKTELKEG